MKVLMINSVCGIRSTGRICTDLADVLAEQGHDCKIAYGREIVPNKYKNLAVKIGNEFSVKMDALQTRVFDNAGFNSKCATRKFIEWIKTYDPDVIHLHNLHGYYLNVKILFEYLKTCGKKIVWTLHDCWAFTGHCAHFDFIGCNRWKTGCFQCPQKKEYPKSVVFERSELNFQEKKKLFTGIKNLTIITPSYWLANLVKESFLKDYKIKVIRNGIDLNAFKKSVSDLREKWGLQDKKVILGVASEWTDKKGLQDYFKLSKMLSEEHRVVLIGLTKEQIKKVPSEILPIEKTNSVEELAQWYTEADVFLNLSYEDTYPTVNLEAQACQTPVVTYATGGSVESVCLANVIEKGNLNKVKEFLEKQAYDKNFLTTASLDKSLSYEEYLKLYEE